MVRRRVSDAITRSGFELSRHLQKLVAAAVVVFSRRLPDFLLRVSTSCCSISWKEIQESAVWRLDIFTGLPTDAILGRTEAFLMQLEGLCRNVPTSNRRNEEAVLSLLSGVCHMSESLLLSKLSCSVWPTNSNGREVHTAARPSSTPRLIRISDG